MKYFETPIRFVLVDSIQAHLFHTIYNSTWYLIFSPATKIVDRKINVGLQSVSSFSFSRFWTILLVSIIFQIDILAVRALDDPCPLKNHDRRAREGKRRENFTHAHISRVFRRANARWPGKRRRRGQSAGIESWSHRHIQRFLGSWGRRQDRRRSGSPRPTGVYLRSDERKLHISRTYSR